PVCNMVSAMINVNDVTGRENEFLQDGQTFTTGKYRFRFLSTPHVPHCWDASLLFEETQSTLFCSDLFTHSGQRPALVSDLTTLAHEALVNDQQGPFHDSTPYNTKADSILLELSKLKPKT